jgi:hypothetical protein
MKSLYTYIVEKEPVTYLIKRVRDDGVVLYKDGQKVIGSNDYNDAAIDALNGYLTESSSLAIMINPLMKNPYINELKKFFLPIINDDPEEFFDEDALRQQITLLEEQLEQANERIHLANIGKWRHAFNYKSDYLNQLYDLIESTYMTSTGEQIALKDLPIKEQINIDEWSPRTIKEADTIITSGQRLGKATK